MIENLRTLSGLGGLDAKFQFALGHVFVYWLKTGTRDLLCIVFSAQSLYLACWINEFRLAAHN